MSPFGYQLMQGFAREGACGASVPKAISLACVAWWFKSQRVARTSTLKHQVLCRFMACLAVASWGSSNWPRWRDYTVP